MESVLKVRKHEEEVQKQKLAAKLSEKKALAEQKRKLQKKLERYLEQAGREDFENLHDLRRHRRYVNEVQKKVEKLNGNLKAIENAVEQQRDKLAAVHKKRHMVEKIKEEEKESFLEEYSRQQRKVMDEVATQTHGK